MAYIIGTLIALPIFTLCGLLIYVLSKSTKNTNQEPPLTPRDLQVLQESAEELINSITAAAEESMKRFEETRVSLEDLITRAEKAAEFLEARLGAPDARKNDSCGSVEEAIRLRQAGLEASDIARRLGMNAGEVELLLNLRPKARC